MRGEQLLIRLVGVKEQAGLRTGLLPGHAKRIANEGGAILIYRSPDLRQWEFMHTLMQGDRNQLVPFWTGTIWECPNLIKLGHRHVLIVSFQHHETGQLLYTGYFIGRYENHHFTPESQQVLD